MRDLNTIEEILKKHKKELEEKYFIRKIGIFGSYSRGEENPESDIDILVEFYASLGVEFFDLKDYLEKILDKHVDLVTENGLRLQMKDRVLKELIYI